MAIAVSPEFEKATYFKVAYRLIPFLFLCYIVAFLIASTWGSPSCKWRETLATAMPCTALVPAYSSSATLFSKCPAT